MRTRTEDALFGFGILAYAASLALPAYYFSETTVRGFQVLLMIPLSLFEDVILVTLWLPNILFIICLILANRNSYIPRKAGFIVGLISVFIALLSVGYGQYGWAAYELRDKVFESVGYVFSYEFVDDTFFQSKRNVVLPELPETDGFAQPISNDRESAGYPLVGYYLWFISHCMFAALAYVRLRLSKSVAVAPNLTVPAQT